ncbi:methyl-accepting chemotaxis protein [Oceanobacter mangrovi]|uniref:methyl-accepting chemotaxis protein n=1 Tax=Oceanobacter mangrovi TaxID=2862510 RepID=UPI001C8D6A09|nr:methyl-accepting chemotaxis protein [Oceanobacter mangrovi]
MQSLPLRFKLFSFTVLMVIVMSALFTWSTYQGINKLSTEVSQQSESFIHEAAVNRLQISAQAYGEQMTGYINAAYRVPLTLARMIRENIISHSEYPISREMLSELDGNMLAANPDVSSIYSQFEPNGFDALDNLYVGEDSIHTFGKTGSLEIYWVRNADGSIEQIKVDDPQEKYAAAYNEFGQREAEWYLCGRDTLKPCIMEPYSYEISPGNSEMMTSLTVPVVIDNTFRGIVGVDINLPTFQKLTDKLSADLYDGNARVTLITRLGLIVASSHYKAKIGRPLTEAMPELGDQLIKLNDGNGVLETDGRMFVSRTLPIKAADNQWSLLIELPQEIALADLYRQQQLIDSTRKDVIGEQLMIAIVLIIIALGLMMLLVRSISQPLSRLNGQVEQLSGSHGDLTQTINLDTHAELIELSGGFNRFLEKLRDMINTLKGVSSNVREMSTENRHISQQTRANTDQQQEEMHNVVTATQEMSATAHEVSRIAADAAGRARDIHTTINDSQRILSSASTSVEQLTSSMHTASESISRVESRSDDINKILEVIRAVAEQTNLLALNAAIEAARAGEQGRGFAVVADEVRTLASKTRASTEEIDSLISSLQEEVRTTVEIIEQGSVRAGGAMESTRNANEALHTVVTAIGDIADHINQVATAAEEQSATSNEITRNLTVIGDATQTLAQLAQEASLSSDKVAAELDKLDSQLQQLNT